MRYTPLPSELTARSFSLADAAAAGVGRARLRSADIGHPFHGVYTAGLADDEEDRCRALAPTLEVDEWFSHLTAARLYRMPLPAFAQHENAVHVTSVGTDDRVRRAGVTGWRVLERPPSRRWENGVRIVAPADVWASLSVRSALRPGTTLSIEWLVAIGDFLVSGERTDAGRAPALCTLAELEAAADRRNGKRGAKALRVAVAAVRHPVDSVKETFLRLGLVGCGLPEPEVQLPVETAHGLRHADLGYRRERLLLEFQGDEHRTSRARWLADLTRVQLLQDAGYRVMLIGDADLVPDCRALAARVRRALTC